MGRFFFTAAFVCAAILPAQAAEPRWQEYRYPEAGFAANFPEAPQAFSRLHATSQSPSGVREQVYSFDEGGVLYSIDIADFTGARADPDIVVNEATQTLLDNGRLESEIALEIDLVHGTEYIVIGADGTRTTDGIFFFKDQLYQVQVVYPPSNSDPAGSSGISFFLAHFRFLDPF
jgi:hypothetical protein